MQKTGLFLSLIHIYDGEDDDPMSVVSNLFDVAMVFALALMVALVSRYNMTEMFSKDKMCIRDRISPARNAPPTAKPNSISSRASARTETTSVARECSSLDETK